MNLTQQDIDALKQEWETVEVDAEAFFRRVWDAIAKAG